MHAESPVVCGDNRRTTFAEDSNPGESASEFGARFAEDLADFTAAFCGNGLFAAAEAKRKWEAQVAKRASASGATPR